MAETVFIHLLLLYFYPSINEPAYMASESLFKPMVDFEGCSWCYQKKDRKAYIFRIFKFFIGPNKVSPLKTGIESHLMRPPSCCEEI